MNPKNSRNAMHTGMEKLDPQFALDRVEPDPTGLSLFIEADHGPGWLYTPGALELWLFHRMRQESFHACLNAYHPGRFRTVNPVLYAARQWQFDRLPEDCRVRISACGDLHVVVNGTMVLHRLASAKPERVEVDLRPHLVVGVNQCRIRVHALAGPPALLMEGEPLCTDTMWVVSTDEQHFEQPQRLACTGFELFPHQERLPEFSLSPARTADGLWDFGREVFGRPELRIRGTGAVRLYSGESAAEARNNDPAHFEQNVPVLEVETGLAVSPVELALRYLRVEASAGITVEQVRLRASTYPVRYRGSFESSDPLLNRIWLHAAYTLRLCMREVFLDGPKRDRLPWVGDLYLAGLANAHVFFDAGIMRRTLLALYGSDPEAIDFNGIIDYSFFWILALHDYVLHFGDRAFLRQMRPCLDRLVQALEQKRDDQALIPTGRCRWLFIDWAEVGKDGYSSCLEFLSIQALDAVARLCQWDGDAVSAEGWQARVEERRAAARARFWSAERQAFLDCSGSNRAGRHANILAVLSGSATEEQCRLLCESVLLDSGVAAVGTPYMRSLELLALMRCGRCEAMLEAVRGDWGGMLELGASSFWERYNAGETGEAHLAMYGRPYAMSFCHAWSAGPVFLLGGELLGCRPLEPGWARFALDSTAIPLKQVKGAIPTPYGEIRIERRDQQIHVQIPAGTVMVCNGEEVVGPAEGEVPRKTSAIYVNPAGSDDCAGPVATLARALEIARSTGVRRIVLQAGRYMDVALQLGPQDSDLVIEAAEGERVTLVGGHTLTGWTDDGDDCIACPVSGVREGTWDFRSLIVNGRFAERARYPETGTLEHASVFNSNWMSTAAGGWDRKPTQEELTTLKYKGDDLGPWLSVRNAEVQIFHHWDDSLVGLSAHDPATKTLTFSSPAGHPAGAFAAWTAKARTYVIWNVREGMTKPGQWYLDRDRGCVVYRLRPGESGARIEAIAPTAQSIIEVKADGEAPARNIVIRNLELMASTTPLKSAGFGASLMPGAIELRGRVEALAIEDCFIHHVGGIGIRGGAMEKVYPAHVAIRRCRIEECGAGGIWINANESCVEDCMVLRTGLVYTSSIALAVQGRSNRIAHNEVAYCPYSAIVAGGTANRVENNRIHHFMETLDDGAAIYSYALKYGVYRGNVAIGSGSPTRLSHAYYLDELSVGSVVEQNLAIDTGWPSHNHMLEFCAIRDNIFIDTHAAKITLMKSYRCFFEGNLVVAKAITVSSPEDGFLSFSNNVLAAADGVTLEHYGPDGYGISGHEPAQAENGNTFENPGVTVSADSVVNIGVPAVLRGRCSNLKTDFRNVGPRWKPSAEDTLPDRASVTKNKA